MRFRRIGTSGVPEGNRPVAGILLSKARKGGSEAARGRLFPSRGKGYPQNSPQAMGQRFFLRAPRGARPGTEH